jgi:hypothetical protein
MPLIFLVSAPPKKRLRQKMAEIIKKVEMKNVFYNE